jgi:hypothetical protein
MKRIRALIVLALCVVLLGASVPLSVGATETRATAICSVTDLTNGAPQTCTISNRFTTSGYLWVVASGESGASSTDIFVNMGGPGAVAAQLGCSYTASITANGTKLYLLGSLATAADGIVGVCDFPMNSDVQVVFSNSVIATTIDLVVYMEYLAN